MRPYAGIQNLPEPGLGVQRSDSRTGDRLLKCRSGNGPVADEFHLSDRRQGSRLKNDFQLTFRIRGKPADDLQGFVPGRQELLEVTGESLKNWFGCGDAICKQRLLLLQIQP